MVIIMLQMNVCIVQFSARTVQVLPYVLVAKSLKSLIDYLLLIVSVNLTVFNMEQCAKILTNNIIGHIINNTSLQMDIPVSNLRESNGWGTYTRIGISQGCNCLDSNYREINQEYVFSNCGSGLFMENSKCLHCSPEC